MRIALVLAALSCTPLPAVAQTRPVTIDDVLDLKAAGAPAISPDGTAVLFTVRGWSDRTERGALRKDARTHVWRVAADGSAPARQLTFGERGDSQPAWSPDGRYISFVSARGPEGDDEPRSRLWVMRSDGGEAWSITDGAENVQQYAWSRDSRRIAFTMTDPRSEAELSAVRARDDEKPFEDRVPAGPSVGGRRRQQGRHAGDLGRHADDHGPAVVVARQRPRRLRRRGHSALARRPARRLRGRHHAPGRSRRSRPTSAPTARRATRPTVAPSPICPNR